MVWLYRFFNRNTCQEQTPPDPTETATAPPPKPPAAATVMQVVAEETIMAVAQWLVTLVNRQIQPKPEAPSPDPSATAESHTTPQIEELLAKFGQLIEQLYDREQRTHPLESRLQMLEAALNQRGHLEHRLQESMQVIDCLNQRLAKIEDLADQVHPDEIGLLMQTTEQLTQQIEQSNNAIVLFSTRMVQLETATQQDDVLIDKMNHLHQRMAVVEQRMQHLENLVARFSIVPKLVIENRHGINALHHQLSRNGNGKRGITASNPD